MLEGKKLVIVSILRAGNGILDGMLDLMPSARVGHIGLYRDPEDAQARRVLLQGPEDIAERQVIVVDPMLATGNSAVAAIDRLKETRRQATIKFVCLLAAPEGVERVPRAPIPTCRSSPPRSTSDLNEHGYIVPGLGDAGDRLFGTK